jgi:hypothetical protein
MLPRKPIRMCTYICQSKYSMSGGRGMDSFEPVGAGGDVRERISDGAQACLMGDGFDSKRLMSAMPATPGCRA